MKKLLVAISILFCSIGFSQTFGNEWIDYNQEYYSFKIWQDGVYRLDYTTLSLAGVPVNSIDPDDFQIFGFEKEQQIWVEDGGDGSFDSGDFIVLYAQKNTTWLDSLMYDAPEDVGNKYFPHYNDTINYFLTWDNTGGHERIQEETDVNFGAYTTTPYFLKKRIAVGSNYYLTGFKIAKMSNANYVVGEGWGNGPVNALDAVSYFDINFSTSNVYSGAGAPNAQGTAVSVGASSAAVVSQYNHHLQLQYGTSNALLIDTSFFGYQKNNLDFSIPAANLGASITRLRHQLVNDLGVAADNQAVLFAEIIYPHTLNLENSSYYELIVPYNLGAGKTRYDFTNFNAANSWAFTLDGPMRKIPVVNNAGTYQALIPNLASGENQRFVIFDQSAIQSISNLTPVNGTGTFTNFENMTWEDAYIILTHQTLWSSASDYKIYRESSAGGNYFVQMIDVDELYDQYGGGVPKHAIAIRRFLHMTYVNSALKPNHVFIIGKGIREANEQIATGNGSRLSATAYAQTFVPSYGYPSSDILLTSKLEGNLWAPLIPIGRLAAWTNQEVQIYLQKVREYEEAQDVTTNYTVQDRLWQKEILHFGGGANSNEQFQFKNYLAHYEETLTDTNFGGNVTGFYKTVSDPIDPTTLYEVTENINDGVSIMTFFGHAAVDGFDQNVDDPNNWDNAGKYPIVVGNACHSGNIHEPNNYSVSENWVLIEDKGVIAFLANVREAFSNSLHEYSNEFFKQVSRYNYGGTIGQHIKRTIEALEQPIMSFGLQNVCLEMTLHGDPALRVNSHPKPELVVDETSIFVTPNPVDLSVDSIDVNVVVYNLGKATNDTFAVELTRTFPFTGEDSTYAKVIPGIAYVDTIVFTIPLYANSGIGINDFTVQVDIPSLIDEVYDEIGNNQITKQVIFDVDGIYPVWPYNYAVVPNDKITLKGSTINPFADFATYRFEIDTTDLYNSGEHMSFTTTSLGGVIEAEYNNWTNVLSGQPDSLILTDSTVYFWRVAVEDTGSYNWIEYSFQYIPGKTGWGQDHFFQFKNNDFLFLNYDRNARRRLFGPAFRIIDCDVYGAATSWLETAYTLYEIDSEIEEYNFCSLTPQLLVVVIDPYTLEPWGTRYVPTGQNLNNDFGNSNDNGGCRPRVEYHFAYPQNDPNSMDSFDDLIMNQVPDGHYVMVYSARYGQPGNWDADNIATFQALGADSIAAMSSDLPFIIFTRKGNTEGPGTAVVHGGTHQEFGQIVTDDPSLKDTLWGYDYYGTESSTVIGPAQRWDALYWSIDSMESPTPDSTRLWVYGITYAGTRSKIIDTLFSPNDSILNLDGIVDANQFPYLQLNAQCWDLGGFTPGQIDRWHVLYQDVPEAALDGSAGILWSPSDTVNEGQDIVVAFDVKNISDLPMDSILINYWLEDQQHNITPIPYPRQDSLRVGQTIRDTLTISSTLYEGLNSLWVEVNPYVSSGQTDQVEKYHFNNLGQIPFYVVGDNENPILDVTFNGYHILNGDIIDPFSEIMITLKDENEFLIMDEESDTANFGIYLTSPDGVQHRLNFRNQFGEPLMEWIPADASSKKFQIIYQGNFEQNGTYRLLVQGVDETGNISGDYEYDIEFEVDHNSSVTYLMNYPNPFSTSTQFVFTLTGSTIPDEFTIQIMTVTGKVVKEITIDELGPLKIGRNVTEYTWDGTDEYGDLLANGVYLYRVIVKINGENVEHRESGADQYFTKSFGKMYILR